MNQLRSIFHSLPRHRRVRPPTLRPLIYLGGTALLLAGCLGRTTSSAPQPSMALPASFSVGAETSTSSRPPPGWWTRYDDPALHRLVEAALAQNLGVRARWTQLSQAKALATQAAAARWPTVSARGTAGFSRSISAFATSNSIRVDASLPVAYEVDLFARWANTAEAADLEVAATREDIAALALSTSAEVAEAWYNLVSSRARKALLEEQAGLNQTYLELVQLRFQQGLTSALDVHQQRQQVATIQAQLELVQGQLGVQTQQLGALLGRPGSALTDELLAPATVELPELGESPSPGVPADLLTARPDIRSAQRRVQAADRRVGAAIAGRLPSIRLAATPGYSWQRNELTGGAFAAMGGEPTTVHGFTFAANATLNVPLFDGFAGRGQVEQQEAALQTQVENLSQVVLLALIEVESAVVQERFQRSNVEVLQQQIAISEQTLESARDRYRQGLSDFLPVLTSLQAQQAIQQNLLTAERQLLSNRIQLHRALGGDWPGELERPAASTLRGDES